ncbi:TPR-like protein [Violaceomyces palustris]|uniref:TPR-like protein n=1 Tax=Violaceomyces palustris TaxID=1673888 RepID=A0ACD0NV61_9BASI|nr:TPR-like protein [Violaceomyces palustris]
MSSQETQQQGVQTTPQQQEPAPTPAPSPPLTTEQKVQVGLENKDRGNQHFQRGDYKSALASYHLACLYLSGLDQNGLSRLMNLSGDVSQKEGETPTPLRQDQKILSQVRSNMAACYIKQSNYEKAIESCEKAIKIDPSNLKASFRKFQSLRLKGEIFKAKQGLEEFLIHHPDEQLGFSSELKLVQQQVRRKQQEADTVWKGFLSRGSSVRDGSGSGASE